jgi:hypothetical protein
LVDEFLDELEKEEYDYKVYQGDFLPLIDDVDSKNENNHAFDYWTGFYSNRPTFKQDVRIIMNSIRMHNKLIGYLSLQKLLVEGTEMNHNILNGIVEITKRASVLLHHDAVTGTCSVSAMDDYRNRVIDIMQRIENDGH